MIIRTFKKSYLPQYLFLVLLSVLLWGGAFLTPPLPAAADNFYLNPGHTTLLHLLGNSPYVMVALAFVIMLASALVFNYTLEKNGLSGANSLIPALVFVLVMGLIPSLQTLHQAMIPGFLIIIVLHYVFDIFTEEEAYPKIFNAGFFIAISSFFYFPSIAFLLFVWLTFIVYRLYNWREWIILVFGFLTPYVLLWTWFFWSDELALAFQAYAQYFRPKVMFDFGSGITILNYFSLALALALFIRGFFTQAISLQENVISVRKRFWSVSLFFLVSLASFLFSGSLAQFHIIFIQISFALIIQGLMFNLERYFVTELMTWILLALIVINNYYVAFQTH